MKKFKMYFVIAALSLAVFQCKEKYEISEPNEQTEYKGSVVETMDSAGYTYVLMKTDDSKYIWLASSEVKVKNGDKVTAAKGAVMHKFTSKTLKKDFSSILFTSGITVDGSGISSTDKSLMKDHLGKDTLAKAEKITVAAGSIKKATGGYTVSECYENAAVLNGKIITVRGKVVKFLPGIMKKNWIHLQDGSGKEGSNDLAVTTAGKTKTGDTIVVTGKLSKDKDFGSGYKYLVIVEEAQIVTE